MTGLLHSAAHSAAYAVTLSSALFLFSCATTQSPPDYPPPQYPAQPQYPQYPQAPVPPPPAQPEAQPQAQAPAQPQTQIPAAEPPGVAPPAMPPTSSPANGQWVYTAQYGWVWMPYGNQYVYYPNGVEAYPSEYVFVYGGGWRWVGAPWVWGYGPRPYWGVYGAGHYGWYRGPNYVAPGPSHWGGRRHW